MEKHSYQAGLWEAKTLSHHYLMEGFRRSLEKVRQVVCINDGAAWIWAIFFIRFARRFEFRDWCHLLRLLWQIMPRAPRILII